jgi:ADP-glucose pyrophosphorylase
MKRLNLFKTIIALGIIVMFSGCKKSSGEAYGSIKYDGKTYTISSASRTEYKSEGKNVTQFYMNTEKDIVVIAEIKTKNLKPDGVYTHDDNSGLITFEEHTKKGVRVETCSTNTYIEVKSLNEDEYELSGKGATSEGKSVEFNFSGAAKTRLL